MIATKNLSQRRSKSIGEHAAGAAHVINSMLHLRRPSDGAGRRPARWRRPGAVSADVTARRAAAVTAVISAGAVPPCLGIALRKLMQSPGWDRHTANSETLPSCEHRHTRRQCLVNARNSSHAKTGRDPCHQSAHHSQGTGCGGAAACARASADAGFASATCSCCLCRRGRPSGRSCRAHNTSSYLSPQPSSHIHQTRAPEGFSMTREHRYLPRACPRLLQLLASERDDTHASHAVSPNGEHGLHSQYDMTTSELRATAPALPRRLLPGSPPVRLSRHVLDADGAPAHRRQVRPLQSALGVLHRLILCVSNRTGVSERRLDGTVTRAAGWRLHLLHANVTGIHGTCSSVHRVPAVLAAGRGNSVQALHARLAL